MPLEKKALDLPTMEFAIEGGPLDGHEFVMYEPPSSLIFGPDEIDRSAFCRAALASVVDSTIEDVGRIPPAWALQLANRWLQAWREKMLPPASGQPSEAPSSGLPSTSPADSPESPSPTP